MPRVTQSPLVVFLFSIAVMISAGCSDTNTLSIFDPDAGHPAGWLPSGHMAAAQNDIDDCTECHGSTFGGGIAGVGCTDCHLGDESNVHPLTWSIPIVDHGPFVVTDTDAPASCGIAVCHGVDFTGGGVGVSCDQCHNTYPHITGWADPDQHGTDARNDILDCKFCHGRSTMPPVYDGDGTGVDCQLCHGTTTSGAPHPANWDPIGTIGSFLHMGRIGNRAGCEECHTDIPGDPGCNFVGCHAGGSNLP